MRVRSQVRVHRFHSLIRVSFKYHDSSCGGRVRFDERCVGVEYSTDVGDIVRFQAGRVGILAAATNTRDLEEVHGTLVVELVPGEEGIDADECCNFTEVCFEEGFAGSFRAGVDEIEYHGGLWHVRR